MKDGFLKIAKLEGSDLTTTVEELEIIGEKCNLDFILSVSANESAIPEGIKDKIVASL